MKKITICALALFSALAILLGLFVGEDAKLAFVFEQAGSDTTVNTTEYASADTSVPACESTGTPEQTTSPEEQTSGAVETSSATEITTSPETTAPEEITTEKPGQTTEAETNVSVTTKTVETQPAKVKYVVGVSATDASGSSNSNCINAAKAAGFSVYILPFVKTEEAAKKQLAKVDAVIMTGGEDLDPSYYGEEKLNDSLDIYPARDVSDMLYIKAALKQDMPMLGICRGMQLINVALGGTLYQDLPEQMPSSSITHKDIMVPAKSYQYHYITTTAGSLVNSVLGGRIKVNSWHHQSVKSAGINVKITAVAEDGVAEAFEVTDKTFVVGVQFHPEAMYSGYPKYLKFFTALKDSIKK